MADRTISDLWRTLRSFFRSAGGFEGKEITVPSNPVSGYRRIYPKTDGWYDLTSGGTETKIGGGGSGDSVKKTYTQASHGFAAGNPVYRSSGAWAKAKADVDATAEVEGIVESVNGNDFVLVESGYSAVFTGTDGAVGFLSKDTAGAITETEPDSTLYVSKPLLTYLSTGAIVNIQRGIRTSTGATGFTRIMAVATATSLAAAGSSSQTFTMAKGFSLLGVDVDSKKCRVRLYVTSAARTADAARGFTIPLALGEQHGCIADFYFDQDYAVDPWICSPPIMGANMDGTPSTNIYAAITNMDLTTQTIAVTLTYTPTES